MPGRGGPDLPYSIVAGVVPLACGWLVASAKLRGAIFAPEEPRLLASFVEVLDDRPTMAVVALNAPVGEIPDTAAGARVCDREVREILGRGPSLDGSAPAEDRLDTVNPSLLARYEEVAREMAPYRQRSVFEVLPELSFLQLHGDEPLRSPSRSADGQSERRGLLEMGLTGVDRILDADLADVVAADLLDAAVCLWSSRRIAAHIAIRLPADAQWDGRGLRMEIVR